MRVLSVALLATLLGSCATLLEANSCNGRMLIETKLYFGLSTPTGGPITEREFNSFIAAEVTPRLPEGFTIHGARGSWQDEASKKTITEKSMVLIRLHQNSVDENRAIEQIAQSYKSKFKQDAVLRTDTQTCSNL